MSVLTEVVCEIEGSTFERTSKSLDELHNELIEAGFEHTGEVGEGNIVHYHESENGVNLTLVELPRGSALFPSGPIRGTIFGDEAVGVNLNL